MGGLAVRAVNFLRLARRFLAAERGVALALVAICLSGFAGVTALVVDVGQLYETRRQLQSGADAAALAGAAYLPDDPNRTIAAALEYAQRNGVEITEDDIEVYSTYVPDDTIRVNDRRNVSYGFARALGLTGSDVTAQATSVVGSMAGSMGCMPWALFPEDPLPFGTLVTLKYNPLSNQGGNFGALAIDGPGAAPYREAIINGAWKRIRVGDWVDTETGNVAGPTKQGLQRLLQGDQTSFDDAVEVLDSGLMRVKMRDCPRIVIVPLIHALPSGGKTSVEIIGFAYVFLVNYHFHAPTGELTVDARFLKIVDPNGTWGPIGNTDYGVRVPKLTQ